MTRVINYPAPNEFGQKSGVTILDTTVRGQAAIRFTLQDTCSNCFDIWHLEAMPSSQIQGARTAILWKKGKDPHPQDKIQHLDFTKDPRPCYYKTPPSAFYHNNAVVGP